MVPSPRISFIIAAVLGWTGCLLFTDPVNQAPQVTIDPHPDPVYRGSATDFTVQVTDEDSLSTMQVRWAEFANKDPLCKSITPTDWVTTPASGSGLTYPFTAKSLGATCLCAQAIDHYGGVGQGCQRIVPVNPTPDAKITDLVGLPIATQQAKCSEIQLSGEHSFFLPDDQIDFGWTLDYAGADPKGKQTQLGACQGATPSKPGAYQCLFAAGSGTYTVGLVITATPPGTAPGSTSSASSTKTSLSITIAEDTPACMQQTSPELNAKWILLARSSNLGAKYESRTFTVSSVRDDCEPFPPTRTDTPTAQQALFVWSVLDGTQGKTKWEVQANPANSNYFKIDQDNFPNARPGDTIGLRVEVRDTPGQTLYQTVGPICTDPSTGTCCGPKGCTGTNDCIRWTTWTVQFQP